MKHDNLITSAHRTINSISTTHKAAMDNAARGKYFSRLLPTGFARRVMLLLAILLVGGNASWGEETILWEGNAEQLVLSGSTVSSAFPATTESTSSLRIYVGKGGLQALCAGWGNAILIGQSGNGGIDANDDTYYNEDDNCYQIPFSACIDNLVNSLKTNGFVAQVRDYDNQHIIKVSIYTPSGSVDTFLNTAKDGMVSGSGSAEKDYTADAYGEFILSAASGVTEFTNLANVKYARVYVTDASGAKLDYDTQADGMNNLLVVTGGQQAGESKKNGLYVYNNGSILDLSSITVRATMGL